MRQTKLKPEFLNHVLTARPRIRFRKKNTLIAITVINCNLFITTRTALWISAFLFDQNYIIVLHQKLAVALSYRGKGCVLSGEYFSSHCFENLWVYFLHSEATRKSIWSERNRQLNMLKDVSYRCSTDSRSVCVCVYGGGGLFQPKTKRILNVPLSRVGDVFR